MAIIEKLTNIANAIRAKTGETGTMTMAEMPTKIAGIQTGINPEYLTYDQRNEWVSKYLDQVNYTGNTTITFTPVFSAQASGNISYTSSNTSIATVVGNGNTATVTGIAVGNATITATKGSETAEMRIDVASVNGNLYATGILAYHTHHDYGNWNPSGVQISTVSGNLITYDGNNNGGIDKNIASVGTDTLYNITPKDNGSIYAITNNDVLKVGYLNPTGAVRMLKFDTLENVRDIGGWQCDGGTVKYGKILRGYLLKDVSEADKKILLDLLHIQQDVSLQYKTDANYYEPSTLGDAIKFVHYDGGGTWWYSQIVNNTNAGKLFKDIMQAAIDGNPQYIHCAQGADRTGTVMFILEAVLGLTQNNLDKDYELTSFSAQRLRNNSDWVGLINAFSEMSGATIRDKVVGWLVRQGVTIEMINSFRSAMIDGTPETLTASINTYNITKSGSNVTYSNYEATKNQYQEYNLEVTADTGFAITGITVTMGGTDITSQVVSGAFIPWGEFNVTSNGEYDISGYESVNVNVSSPVVTKYTISKTLNDSTANNANTEAIANESYAVKIVPTTDHEIVSVSVTIGGTDVSSSVLTLFEED